MFDVRLRLMSDDGRIRGRMLAPQAMQVTMVDSGMSTLTFSVSERVAARLDAPFVVSMVVSADGGAHSAPRSALFIVDELNTDDADTSKTVQFSGIEYVPWLLSMNRMAWSTSAKNGTRKWVLTGGKPTSPGYLMAGLITEGKARGWGEQVSIGFSGTVDSNGAAWTAAENQSEEWPLLKPASEILTQMTENGLCDWYTQGTTLHMVRPGTGPLRSNVVLGGPKFTARPVKSSFKNVFTHLTVVPEKARNWLYLTNPGATGRFGRLEASMTQSGVEKHSEATRLAQPALTQGRATRSELSFDWTPDAGGPIPFEDFNIGDTVWTKSRSGKMLQRVIGLQINRTGKEPVKVRAITGDKLIGTAARMARRIGSVSVGGGPIGGTGTSIPSSKGPTFPVPAAPTGLRVEANNSTWGADGKAVTSVTLAWDAVSQAEDGSEVDVEAYEVGVRMGAVPSSVAATTDALEWTATGWPVGEARGVRVRAVAPNGDRSAWSAEISVTPESPATPVKVTGLAVVSQYGSWRADGTAQTDVTLTWDVVSTDTGGNVIPVTYEVSSRFPQRIDGIVDEPTITMSSWEPGKTRYVKVRAVSGMGKGEWSDELEVLVDAPASIVPKAPTNLAVVMNAGAFEKTGRAFAMVYLTWDRVTESVDGVPVTIEAYEVLEIGTGEQPSVHDAPPDPPLAIGMFTAGVSLSFQARARSTLGVWSDWSAPFTMTSALPALTQLPPADPTLTTSLGGVSARWDGNVMWNGQPVPHAATWVLGFSSVQIEVDTGSGWAPVGGRLTSEGSAAIAGTVGETVTVRAKSYDALGRLLGTSQSVSIVVAGVSLEDIDPDLSGELDSIRLTADGKNRVYVQTAPPGAGVVKRLNLFDDPIPWSITAPNGGIARWFNNGATSAKLLIEADGWLRLYADTTTQTDATAARATGWGGSAKAVAENTTYTISMDMEAKAGLSDLRFVWWAYTATGTAIGGERVVLPARDASGRVYYSFTTPATTGRIAMVLRRNPQTGWANGDWYRIRHTRLTTGTDTGYFDGSSLALPGFGYRWTATPNYSTSEEIESAFSPGDLWLELDAAGTSVVAVNVWNGSAWVPQVLYADRIIAAESITSPLIKAGEIQVNHVSHSFGNDLNLSANETVNIIVGQVADVQGQVSEQQSLLDRQAAEVSAAQAAAEAAASGASSAGIAAAAASAAAATAQKDVDKYGKVFAFEADGLGISAEGSPMSLKLTNADITIRRDGVVKTTWNETEMIVPRLRTAQVVVGKTVITEKPTGMTWQRL